MSWTDISSEGYDWQPASFINEFVSAIAERALLVGVSDLATLYSAMFPVSAGDDIQDHLLWERMQQWCLDNCDEFVQSETYDPVTQTWSTSDFDGAGTLPLWTEGNFKAYIAAPLVLNPSFRRYTTHPDDGGTLLYGVMEANDIIGPWIFEDLQKALNALEWTKELGILNTTTDRQRHGAGGWWATEQAAWDDAKTDWDGNAWVSVTAEPVQTDVGMYADPGPSYSVPFAAPAYRVKGQWEKTGLSILACDVDTLLFFSHAWVGETFLAQGDALAEDDTFKRWSGSGVGSKAAGVTSTGETNMYNAVDTMPPDWDSSTPQPYGWVATCWFVLDWAVTDGFTYRE